MSVAILVSITTRNGILGVLAPLIIALLTMLLDLIGQGWIVHSLLIGSAFDGWHGLFVAHPFFGPFVVSACVCLVWIAACLIASWQVLRRRDFVAATSGANWRTPLSVVAVAVVVIAILALCSSFGPKSVTSDRLAASLGQTFNNATLRQQQLIGRYAPPNAQFKVLPNCHKGGSANGPGDYRCNLYVYLPQPKSVPFQRTNVEYDVNVAYNGCWKASSPPAFIGGQTMADTKGRQVTNPLFVVYGCFNIF